MTSIVRSMITFWRSNLAFVLYNGQDLGAAVGGGNTIGAGKMLPSAIVVQAIAAMSKKNAP